MKVASIARNLGLALLKIFTREERKVSRREVKHFCRYSFVVTEDEEEEEEDEEGMEEALGLLKIETTSHIRREVDPELGEAGSDRYSCLFLAGYRL